jgi:hypothetical protein
MLNQHATAALPMQRAVNPELDSIFCLSVNNLAQFHKDAKAALTYEIKLRLWITRAVKGRIEAMCGQSRCGKNSPPKHSVTMPAPRHFTKKIHG